MGLTTITAKIGKDNEVLEMEFLVDSGASFTVLPEKAWKKLGLEPIFKRKFSLADGTIIQRDISEVWFEFGGERATIQVVLGEGNDTALLGVLTLEALGLMINPFSRELVSMKLMLARME